MVYKITPPQNNLGQLEVKLPASKSLSNRALIINALSSQSQNIENLAVCDDTEVMLEALRNQNNSYVAVDVHGAGTAMRFLTAYFSMKREMREITGSARMIDRPIGILVDALRELGAKISYFTGREGYPPLIVGGRHMHGGEITLPANVSSQFVSALLMIAPCLNHGLVINLKDSIVSRPYIDMTVSLMRRYGAKVQWRYGNKLIVEDTGYTPIDYTVENDWSAASYWYEIVALLPQGTCTVFLPGLSSESIQGDSKVAKYFKALGVETKYTKEGVEITKGNSGVQTHLLDLDLSGEPDLAQTLVATCCALGVNFRFMGLANLRIKETDRIEALKTEFAKFGFVIKDDFDDTIFWDGEKKEPQAKIKVATYNDHRMAMCLAPLSIVVGDILIDDPVVVEKSYPGYWRDLQAAAFGVETEEE